MGALDTASQDQPRPGSHGLGRLKSIATSKWGARITAYALCLIGWQLFSMVVARMPQPWEVLRFVWVEVTGGSHGGVVTGEFLDHFLVTLERFIIGLGLALAGGTVVGFLIGSSSLGRALVNDTLRVFLALPAIIWAFLTIMWFGPVSTAPIVTAALSAAPFIAVNVAQGIGAIGPELHRMSAAFRVPWAKRMWHLVLPAVMGYLFAGIRFAIIVGWNGVLLSEWFGASRGVGYRARFWYDANRYRGFVGWVVIFIVFLVALDQLVLAPIQRGAFRWRDAQAQLSEKAGAAPARA